MTHDRFAFAVGRIRLLHEHVLPSILSTGCYVTSRDDTLHALDALSGTALLSIKVGYSLMGSPAVADGVLYLDTYQGQSYAYSLPTGVGVGGGRWQGRGRRRWLADCAVAFVVASRSELVRQSLAAAPVECAKSVAGARVPR